MYWCGPAFISMFPAVFLMHATHLAELQHARSRVGLYRLLMLLIIHTVKLGYGCSTLLLLFLCSQPIRFKVFEQKNSCCFPWSLTMIHGYPIINNAYYRLRISVEVFETCAKLHVGCFYSLFFKDFTISPPAGWKHCLVVRQNMICPLSNGL